MEMQPGIHFIEEAGGANCYLVLHDKVNFLVDTGGRGNAKIVTDYIISHGKKPEDIQYIILTHSDPDHSGSVVELKKATGAQLGMHPADAAIMSGEVRRKVSGMLRPLFALMSRMNLYPKIRPNKLLLDGAKIGDFEIVHCAGHTSGSIAIYLPGEAIFVGDALKSDSEGKPRLPSKALAENYAEALEAAKRISNLEFDVMLPGHGTPVVGQASAKVKKLFSNQARRH